MITCQEARLALWPEPGPRAASPEVAAAFTHYAACGECQRFFAVQADLRDRVRRAAHAVRAPRALRERVYAGLAARRVSRGERRRRWRVGVLALAPLAAAAVLLVVLGRPASAPDRVVQPFVDEVLRDLTEGMVTDPNPNRVARWFAERIGHAVPVLDIGGAKLIGGRIAYIDGVRSSALHYETHGTPLTYFVVPGTEVMGRTVPSDEVVTLASRGFEVVLWREGDATHAIAAPMRRDELAAIAEECRRKLRMAS